MPPGSPAPFAGDVAVVGGCGHVGLPLGLAFAARGLDVALYDIDPDAVAVVGAGRMPFTEPGAETVLAGCLGKNLAVTGDPAVLARAEHVVVVVGTPVDEHLNPDPGTVVEAVRQLAPHLRPGQLLVLRSTLYPGTTALVERLVADLGLGLDVACCPERIAEGRAMTELAELPQLVAARSEAVLGRAEKLFGVLAAQMVRLSPEEAELAKLFTNTWRYIAFATANQLFMMANDFGLDYERIRRALTDGYPRAADLPRAGFAAGPCLLKDTMQLAAFNNNNFVLGQAAMAVNEGLPHYLVSHLALRYPLERLTVGVLGMAFKAGSDDVRDSLSYKLRRILAFRAARVLCTDPLVTSDPGLVPLSTVLAEADLLIVAAPHEAYRHLETDADVVDITGRCVPGTP